MLDYTEPDGTVDLPGKDDCDVGRINAISWWTPMENGAFFSGVYLGGLCSAFEKTGLPRYEECARRIADGLMRVSSVGDVPGFIARGVYADGTSHYPIGSDDQTGPWFYRLWKYLKSSIPDNAEKRKS